MKPTPVPPQPVSDPPKLDDVDIRILRYLVSDARMSQRAISREIGMSAPAVADRITRLEASGVIEGYHVALNYTALGRPMTVLIEVTSDRSSRQVDLAQHMIEIPEIESVEVVTGAADMVLTMRVRDQAHLSEVLLNTILQSSPAIRRTVTNLVLRSRTPDSFDDRLLESMADTLRAARGE